MDNIHTNLSRFAAGAGKADEVKQLVETGVNVNFESSRYKMTALMVAASQGHCDVVKQLIAGNVDIGKVAEGTGRTALDLAVDEEQWEVAKILRRERARRDSINSFTCIDDDAIEMSDADANATASPRGSPVQPSHRSSPPVTMNPAFIFAGNMTNDQMRLEIAELNSAALLKEMRQLKRRAESLKVRAAVLEATRAFPEKMQAFVEKSKQAQVQAARALAALRRNSVSSPEDRVDELETKSNALESEVKQLKLRHEFAEARLVAAALKVSVQNRSNRVLDVDNDGSVEESEEYAKGHLTSAAFAAQCRNKDRDFRPASGNGTAGDIDDNGEDSEQSFQFRQYSRLSFAEKVSAGLLEEMKGLNKRAADLSARAKAASNVTIANALMTQH